MRIRHLLNGRIVCADDVLPPALFDAARREISTTMKMSPDKVEPDRIWARNAHTNPKISSAFLLAEKAEHAAALRHVPGLNVHPVGNAIDDVLEAIRVIAEETQVAGEPGLDWVGLMGSAFHYDAADGMSFHTDGSDYSCAFSFYVHETWDSEWGGNFLYVDGGIGDHDDGAFLAPRPNRVILVAEDVAHAVSTVHAPPGVARLALTGFFLKPHRGAELLAGLLPAHPELEHLLA